MLVLLLLLIWIGKFSHFHHLFKRYMHGRCKVFSALSLKLKPLTATVVTTDTWIRVEQMCFSLSVVSVYCLCNSHKNDLFRFGFDSVIVCNVHNYAIKARVNRVACWHLMRFMCSRYKYSFAYTRLQLLKSLACSTTPNNSISVAV